MDIRCPYCDAILDVTDDLVETMIECPGCHRPFVALPPRLPTPPLAKQAPTFGELAKQTTEAAKSCLVALLLLPLLGVCIFILYTIIFQ